jgi:uncharacterized protein (DUF58 family)
MRGVATAAGRPGDRADRPALDLELEPRLRIVGSLLGQAASRRRGRSHDVVGARPYIPGDDTRMIDWAASARLSVASGHEQLIVREYHSEEAPTVVVGVDGGTSMQRFPAPLPWLHKPSAVAACVEALAVAAAAGRSQLAVLDADTWLPPRHRLPQDVEAPEPSDELPLDALVGRLLDEAHLLPPGSFVFHLSDFREPPPTALLESFAEVEWHLVPVVVRDPIWEQSYPVETAGVSLPLADDAMPVRLDGRSAAERRAEHELAHAELLASFARAGYPAVVVGSARPRAVVDAFLAWSEAFEAMP